LNRIKPDNNGFTIIEVLVSLAILVIVLGAVYSTFFTVNRALSRFNDVSLKYHEVRTALYIIRREIEASVFDASKAGKEMGENEESLTPFSFIDKDIFGKSASELKLTAFSFSHSGINIISYHVEGDNEGLRLIKKESPLLQQEKGYYLDMIDGIESFTVETLYKKEWVKVWNAEETGGLPDIVRVTIEFNDSGRLVKLREYATPMTGERQST
jgi:general secretion pathway protein J